MFDYWFCSVCGKKRLDKDISVAVHDYSPSHKLPNGTLKRNVKYCNDNLDCKEKAEDIAKWKLW